MKQNMGGKPNNVRAAKGSASTAQKYFNSSFYANKFSHVCVLNNSAIFCHRHKNSSSLFRGSAIKRTLFVTFMLYLGCQRVF